MPRASESARSGCCRVAHLPRCPEWGTPIGRIVGPEAMKFGGWQRLHAEYAKQFDVRK